MPKPIVWLAVIAVAVAAYVLGAKAGRSRYREISDAAKHMWNDPSVKKVRNRSRKAVDKAADKAIRKLG